MSSILCFTVENADQLSPGELAEQVSEKEQNFLSLCRNVVTGLDTSDIMRRIEISRKGQAKKNKEDASEFLGKDLPNLSILLPKVFDSPKVQV